MTIDKLKFRKLDVPSTTKVVLEGKAAPHSEVVVENKSMAVFAPTETADTFVRTKAGEDGSFSVELPTAREGDRVVVKSGASAIGLRVANVESIDGRPPVVRQQGLRLVPANDGFVFTQVCKSPTVGEPGQIFRLTNVRTREEVSFTLDDDGRLPKNARVGGQAGDAWSVSTSDGTHDVTSGCGLLVAPSDAKEPAAAAQAKKSTFTLRDPLFTNGPSAKSVKQGEIGDCWLVSACDAIATTKPERLRNMMKDNGDGTVTVTFKRFDQDASKYVDEHVTVTREVYGSSTPVYGKSLTGEAWFPLLEKAYAQWKGGYDGIRSGYPFEAFEAILGAEGKHFDLDVGTPDAVWNRLLKQTRKGDAMVAWSRVDTPALSYSNTGLVGDHAYAVLGAEQRGEERIVRVRNPWNSNNWGDQLKMTRLDGGILEMKLDVFMKYYAGYGAA
jgi:hypothetical protein